MAFRATCVALLLSALSVAGCGTVANQVRSRPEAGGKDPFGGVRHDVACIQHAGNGECDNGTHATSASEHSRHVARMLLCAVDLPFSLIGDVVLWPYTVTYNFINQPVPVPPVVLPPALGPVPPAVLPPVVGPLPASP